MTDNAAWSQESPADVVGIVEAAMASVPLEADVTDGRAAQGAQPPFVACWQLDPDVFGAGMGVESFGVFHQRWQINPHGTTQGQARVMAEAITTHTWPDGWEFVEIGPMVPDDTDIPDTWFYPLTFVCRSMTAG